MLNEIMDYLGIAGTNRIWLLAIITILGLLLYLKVASYLHDYFNSSENHGSRSCHDRRGYENQLKYSALGVSVPPDSVPEMTKEDQTWTCPRCQQEIGEDPDADDSDMCPICKKSFWNMTCPHCGKDIWADSEVCSECQEPLTVSKCHNCGRQIFVSQYEDNCPYCDADLWICPRCNQYIDTDPEPDDFQGEYKCPQCDQLLVHYDCPKCGQSEIFIDQDTCPGCNEKLLFEPCPDCGEKIPSGLEQCPYCNEDLSTTECPHCQKTHYLND